MKTVKWPQVRQEWIDREDQEITGWHEHFVKKRGYESVAKAREGLIRVLGLNQMNWEEIPLEDPINEIGKMYPNLLIPTVKKIVTNREATDFRIISHDPFFLEHEKVKGILENPPEETTLITLRNSDEKRVVLDGLHRGAAFPRMEKYNGQVLLHEAQVSNQQFDRIFNAHPDLYYQRLLYELWNMGRGRVRRLLKL